jgi:ATP-dependent DNA helicase RecG
MRLPDEELEALLNDLESDRAERKESFKGDAPEKLRQAICAFANDLPGYQTAGVAFVGVKDDGTPSGLAITDELLLELADIRSDGLIQPMPSMTVEKRVLRGAQIAVITVLPADAPRFDIEAGPISAPGRAVTSPRNKTSESSPSGDVTRTSRSISTPCRRPRSLA